jgi:hypothetical protein
MMKRPARAWWSTLFGLFAVTAVVPAGMIDQAADMGDWAPMIALTWMIVLAALPLLFPYFAHTPFDEVVALLCAMCLTPTILALWAAARGGGSWLPVTGWVLSTLALDVVVRLALRDGRARKQSVPTADA